MSAQHKIFSASENCLTEEQLLLYIQHKLSPFEQHHVEKHLLDCELCSDALEGLRLNTSPERLTKTFADLNQQIANRVKQEEKKIIPLYPWLRIAAVIVLIAVSAGTFLYLQKEQKQEEKVVAEKKPGFPPTPPQTNFELKSAESVPAEPSKEAATKLSKELKVPAETDQKNIDKRPVADAIKSSDVSTSTIAAVTEEKENREAAPQTVIEQPLSKSVKENKLETVSENAGAMEKSTAENARPEAAFAKKQKADIQNQLSNSAAIINNAKFQIQNNQYDSANLLLDEVINNNDSNYMEEAMWNKSIALEKLNRKEDAKIVLQKIVVMNGKYKKKAKEKLKAW